jgi:hypothetical protein
MTTKCDYKKEYKEYHGIPAQGGGKGRRIGSELLSPIPVDAEVAVLGS